MNRKITQQQGKCALCGEKFTDYSNVIPYADVGIGDRMPAFRICRCRPTRREVVRRESVSAYLQCLKKRKERVSWSVTATIGVDWRGPGEGLFP